MLRVKASNTEQKFDRNETAAIKRWTVVGIAAIFILLLPQIFVDSQVYARIISIAGICLLLWITEIVPPFVPTLLLLALVPLLLANVNSKYGIASVLSWAADPVMLLFFGGLVLGVATERTGLDKRLMNFAVQRSGNSYGRFLFLLITITAVSSMWISNIAAAALVFACLRSTLVGMDQNDILRRTALIGVALGADLGGIATPIGTGPNAIAIASISPAHPVSFLSWMAFALPLTVGLLVTVYLLLCWRTHGSVHHWTIQNHPATVEEIPVKDAPSLKVFLVILSCTIAAWLLEPFHGIPASIVALGTVVILFASRILRPKDLSRIDWSTLLLIAGGITMGRLLEQSGAVTALTANVPLSELHPVLTLFLLCLTSAALSALMSNTATVVLLIPLAMTLIPSPSTAVLVAIAASFGVPLLISTPPNAMAFGQGGVRFGDMFWPGLIIMILGCVLVTLTGTYVLNLAGIP